MRITHVKISLKDDEKLKAFATVTLDDCFVVRGLKVIHGAGRLFVAMPARRKHDGSFQDIAHPIHAEARRLFEDRVLDEYQRVCRESPPPSGAEA
ncbi:MAG: SpoVG family protein [Candidatus Krumholzibacteriia bacterium]